MSDWTPAQARYDRYATLVTTTRGDEGGCTIHFVPTRHGVAGRVWVGDGGALVEIVLRRPSNSGATYQGHVAAVPGGWAGYDPSGVQVTAVHTNYIDAEAPLLRLRTRTRSTGQYPWPRYLLAA